MGSTMPFEFKKGKKNIKNLLLVYYIVSNAVKMFKKMSISLIENLICIKAYFLLKNVIIKTRGSAENLNFGKGFRH